MGSNSAAKYVLRLSVRIVLYYNSALLYPPYPVLDAFDNNLPNTLQISFPINLK